MASIVITADHVYLPLDEDGNGRSRLGGDQCFDHQGFARAPDLQVPADLARLPARPRPQTRSETVLRSSKERRRMTQRLLG